MRTILLGKNGQLGSELVKVFKSSKNNFLGLGREDVDVTDYKKIQKIILDFRPDLIINTTAIHATAESYPEKLFSVNAFALHNLAVICEREKIKLVNYSTDYVFDGKKRKPYTEKDRVNPLQMYGLSKSIAETISTNYNPDTIVIRTCGVYGGLKGSRTKGNFVLNMLKEAKQKSVIEVSGEQIVSPTYAVDLAVATKLLIKKNPKGGVYHLVNEGYCSWADFTKKIMEYKKLPVTVRPVNRGGVSGGIKRPKFSALANTRASRLGVVLPHWEDALKRYIKFISHEK